MSSSVSAQPQPLQWWGHKKHTDDRAYFIGRTPNGEMVWQCRGDSVEVGNLDWSDWEHLEDCDSWEWQSEPVPSVPEYPKYWDTEGPTFAYLVQTARNAFKVIKKDGSEIDGGWWKDLPVVNARIPVTLYWYDGAIVGRYADSPVTDPSFVPIHSDGNGGWFIERSEDAGN